MLKALPYCNQVDFLHAQMRPLLEEKDIEAFERSYFVSEYWLKKKDGKYTCNPGCTPFGLGAHAKELYDALGGYELDVYMALVDALTHNIAEFNQLDVSPTLLEVPLPLCGLLDRPFTGVHDQFMGIQVVAARIFPAGAIYSAPEFGRYLAFPTIEKAQL